MPYIQVNAPRGALQKTDQDTLMSRLSTAILRAEGADVTDPAALALAWAQYNEVPQDSCYVGGQILDQPPLIITFVTPQGALNDDARKDLAAEVGGIVNDIVGLFEDRLNHWALLQEVSEGSWCGSGMTFPLAGIQAAMNIKAA